MPAKKLMIWYKEAYKEIGVIPDNKYRSSYITFPKSFCDKIDEIPKKKVYDFIFIGGLKTDNMTFENRKWILPFIDKYFNENSYLQFTDHKTKKKYVSKGNYDYTLLKKGFVPKANLTNGKINYFDINYYENMCKSTFCLCPAGDVNWSYRFFESLLCRVIPIVNKESEAYRNGKNLGYKYYLTTSPEFIYRQDWVDHNYELFMKYHTLRDFKKQSVVIDDNNKPIFKNRKNNKSNRVNLNNLFKI
jgi:hypothetical protein